MKLVNWINNNRFITILIVMILMWTWLMAFFYLKADEVTKDPCSICAKRMGETVLCKTVGPYLIPNERLYYPNGTIYNNKPGIAEDYPGIDESLFDSLEVDAS